jgi:hypothetical protein
MCYLNIGKIKEAKEHLEIAKKNKTGRWNSNGIRGYSKKYIN